MTRANFYWLMPLVFAALALAVVSRADDAAQAGNQNNKKARNPSSVDGTSTRSKSIKFEDDVVEGMNKNPLDSAENLGRRDGNPQGHLYHKPIDFRDATRQTVHEMGKTQ